VVPRRSRYGQVTASLVFPPESGLGSSRCAAADVAWCASLIHSADHVSADDWGEHAKLIAKQHEGQVLLISAVPHSWLFPRCAAVVHHGGAGAP
jgi:UDP:flavonoid glycosyltransferase YjiC (YdhE family)